MFNHWTLKKRLALTFTGILLLAGALISVALVNNGTLRDPGIDEPTYLERHHPGTSFWHALAPVAVQHFPYNRSTVWACPSCRRGFLQYTEAGGYYVDHRVRALNADLVVDVPLPDAAA